MKPARVLLVGSAGLTASGLSFIVLVLAQRRLDATAFVDFGVVWGLIFGSASILAAFELESARATAGGDRVPVRLATLTGVALALVVIGASPFLVSGFSLAHPAVLSGLLVSSALYPLNGVTRGWLAGADRLGSYALASLLEGALRLAPLVVLSATEDWHFTLAAGVGSAAFLPWLPRLLRHARASERVALRTEIRHAWWSVGSLMSGQVAAAILITGMPATLTLVLGSGDTQGIAMALILVSVSRLPLILLSSVYGLLVPWFRRELTVRSFPSRRLPWQMAVPAAAVILGIGALALQLVARVLFSIDGDVGFWLAALFVGGGSALGGLQTLTARLVAQNRHSTVQLVWWASVGAAIVCLILGRVTSLTPALSVGLAQLAGPALGMAILAGTRHRPDPRAAHV